MFDAEEARRKRLAYMTAWRATKRAKAYMHRWHTEHYQPHPIREPEPDAAEQAEIELRTQAIRREKELLWRLGALN